MCTTSTTLGSRVVPSMVVASMKLVRAVIAQSTSLGFATMARVFTPHRIQNRTDDVIRTSTWTTPPPRSARRSRLSQQAAAGRRTVPPGRAPGRPRAMSPRWSAAVIARCPERSAPCHPSVVSARTPVQKRAKGDVPASAETPLWCRRLVSVHGRRDRSGESCGQQALADPRVAVGVRTASSTAPVLVQADDCDKCPIPSVPEARVEDARRSRARQPPRRLLHQHR